MSSPANLPQAEAADSMESQRRGPAVPIWLIVLLSLLLFWGAVYFDSNGGWFNAKVYAPYHTVAEVQSFQPSTGGLDLARGRMIFDSNCGLCHGTDGAGKANQGPPVDGSEWVVGNPNRLIRIPLHGLTGPIRVKGQDYNMSMAAMGAALSAEDLAAVLTYMRSSWGNSAEPITPEQVQAVKDEVGNRAQQWTADELSKIQ
jgi:mono/diheme cytochrome c family protein